MKKHLTLIFILLLFSQILSLNIVTDDFDSIPNLSLDIRELGHTMNKPLSSLNFKPNPQQEQLCKTNVPLQLSLILSDRLQPLDKSISPMNSISCYKPDETYSCKATYSTLESLEADMDMLLSVYNSKGAQLMNSNPYKLDDERKGIFPACSEFPNEVDYFKTKKIKVTKISSTFKDLKLIIFNKGSILAAFYAPVDFISQYSRGIYVYNDTEDKDSYVLLRIIGWKRQNNKDYWIFGFTKDTKWGINNFGMMEIGTGNLSFYDIEELL